MVVVTVEDFDVHAGFGHTAGEQAELARYVLLQALNEHVSFGEDADARGFERGSSGGAVFDEEVSDAFAARRPRRRRPRRSRRRGPEPHPFLPKRLGGFPGRLIGLSSF